MTFVITMLVGSVFTIAFLGAVILCLVYPPLLIPVVFFPVVYFVGSVILDLGDRQY